jgi:hypothetical protein
VLTLAKCFNSDVFHRALTDCSDFCRGSLCKRAEHHVDDPLRRFHVTAGYRRWHQRVDDRAYWHNDGGECHARPFAFEQRICYDG